MFISLSAGGSTKGSVPAVLFLWQNWHNYFTIADQYFNVDETGEFSWRGASPGSLLHGEWFLTQFRCNPQSGVLHLHSYATCLNILTKAESVFQYRRLPDGRVWYCAGGYAPLPRPFAPFSWFFRLLGQAFGIGIARRGGEVALAITQDPSLVRRKCGEEAYWRYMDYIDEHKAIERGEKVDARYFREFELRPIALFTDEDPKRIEDILRPFREAWLGSAQPGDPALGLLESSVESVRMGLPRAGLFALAEATTQWSGDPTRSGSAREIKALQALLRRHTLRPARVYGASDRMLQAELAAFNEVAQAISTLLTREG
jgi:hypothetical protein